MFTIGKAECTSHIVYHLLFVTLDGVDDPKDCVDSKLKKGCQVGDRDGFCAKIAEWMIPICG